MADGQKRSVSCLPSDVLEKILAGLPLKSKLACRCVCRSWNSNLSSDNLLSYTTNSRIRGVRSSSGYGDARLLLTTKGPFACALDPICNAWLKLPKPACPGASVLAAAHDLACVGNQVSECRSLIVFNLANYSWKLLPNMRHVGLIHKVTMLVDPITKAYVIVVSGEDSSNFRGRCSYRLLTEVYDSVNGSWHMADDAPANAKFGSDPGVWCNGLFYCITELPYGLSAFNLAKGCWIEFNMDMPEGIVSPSLMSCMGQVMMVGVQDRFPHAVGTANYMDPNTNYTALSELRPPAMLSRMRLSLTRSLSWSGPLQMWASSQLRLTMTAWPSIASAWSSRSSSPVSSSPPSPSSPSSSNLSSPSSSPTSLLMASSTPPSPPPLQSPPSMKCIKVWSLEHGKLHWRVCEEMPDELCEDFMSHLTPRTAIVTAGVEEDVCLTSCRSPNVVIFNMRRRDWRLAESDPFFPRSRDAHLLGFTVRADEGAKC